MITGSDEGRDRIETPERVDLSLDLAGVGSRGLACLLDTLILLVAASLLLVVAFLTMPMVGSIALVVMTVCMFLLFWFYFTFFEATRHGQTPGKRVMGLRVQKVGGYAIGWTEALIRNLLRIVDGFFFYALGVVVMLITRRHQRIGDLAAGTIVVRENVGGVAELEKIGYDSEARPLPVSPVGGSLTVTEFETLHDFLARRGQIHSEARSRIEAQLASALRRSLEERGPLPDALARLDDEIFLLHLDAAYRGEPIAVGPLASPPGEP